MNLSYIRLELLRLIALFWGRNLAELFRVICLHELTQLGLSYCNVMIYIKKRIVCFCETNDNILIIGIMPVIKYKQNINLCYLTIVRYTLSLNSLVLVQIWFNVSNNSLKHSKICSDDLRSVNGCVIVAFKVFKGFFP